MRAHYEQDNKYFEAIRELKRHLRDLIELVTPKQAREARDYLSDLDAEDI